MPKQKDSTDDTTNNDPAPQDADKQASPAPQPHDPPPPETPAAPQSTSAVSTPATGEVTAGDQKAADEKEKKLAGELGEGPVDVVYDHPEGPPLIGIVVGGGNTIYFEKGVTQALQSVLAAKLLLSGKGFSRAAAPAPQKQ